jgi:hypothetical protein
MRQELLFVVVMALLGLVRLDQARAEALPTEVGECRETTIEDIGYRLGDPDSGEAKTWMAGTSPAMTKTNSVAKS